MMNSGTVTVTLVVPLVLAAIAWVVVMIESMITRRRLPILALRVFMMTVPVTLGFVSVSHYTITVPNIEMCTPVSCKIF
jgi:hypothetical protein